jgi:hypothetical protein
MLIGYMRVSTDSDRQVLDLPHQRLCLAPADEMTENYDGY